MLIKVTVVSYKTNIADITLDSPKVSLVNPLKIVWIIPKKGKGTELKLDDINKSTLIVLETPEEIYELLNKE